MKLLANGFGVCLIGLCGQALSADLIGRVVLASSHAPAAGAQVSVTCNAIRTGPKIANHTGLYRVAGLPNNALCRVGVRHGDVDSSEVRLRVRAGNNRLNLELVRQSQRWLLRIQ